MQVRGTEWKFGLIFLKQYRKEKKRREKNERENDKKKGCYIYKGILSFES